jgi:hypothetical protein
MASAQIPSILKHCALAIFNDPHLPGSTKLRFLRALKIAKARLVEYQFLTEGSEDRPADKVGLTAKGKQREQLHLREGPAKNKKFDALYRLVEVEETRGAEHGDAAKDTKATTPAVPRSRR